MPIQFYKIILVVDRYFGDRLQELARSFHVWVVESPCNTPVIHRIWEIARSELDADTLGPGVTSFKAGATESAQDICVRILGDIDEHHGEFAHDPPWSEIDIYGALLNDELLNILKALGATTILPTSEGFIGRR